jgi:hypothetical protein
MQTIESRLERSDHEGFVNPVLAFNYEVFPTGSGVERDTETSREEKQNGTS